MRDKVSRNSINSSSAILDDSVVVPTNILSPPASTSASTFLSSSTSPTTTSFTLNQSTPFDTQSLLISPINNPSNDSYNTTTTATTFAYSSSIQPIVLDDDDIPPPVDNPSYVDLQPCSLNVSFEQPQSLKRKMSSNEKETSTNHRKHFANEGKAKC